VTRVVRLRDEADQDLAAAASWYEQQRGGLGHEFLDVVHRETRRALMTRFPFGIYSRVEEPLLAKSH
jgi:hypothetical protein